jgi:hypothetical protein
MIERPNVNPVKRVMSRVRATLISVIPALLVVASWSCFSEQSSACEHLRCLLGADDRAQHNRPLADGSFDQAVQHSSRRANVQPGSDGFFPPAIPAQSQFATPCQPVGFVALPHVSQALSQRWQFIWRTALEPRGPSLVS